MTSWCDYQLERHGQLRVGVYDAWTRTRAALVALVDAELRLETDPFPPVLRFGLPEEP